jgi:hypothetical protein
MGDENQPNPYRLWVDILFLVLFGSQIAFNIFYLVKNVKDYLFRAKNQRDELGNGQKIILLIIFLLTISLGCKNGHTF